MNLKSGHLSQGGNRNSASVCVCAYECASLAPCVIKLKYTQRFEEQQHVCLRACSCACTQALRYALTAVNLMAWGGV